MITRNAPTKLLGAFFLALCSSIVDGLKEPILHYGGRIVGGQLVQQKDFPYLVSIQKFEKKWTHACGGSIINPRWILTACHCVAFTKEKPLKYKDAKDYRVVAGVTEWNRSSPERQEVRAEKFLAHQKCNRRGWFRPYTYYDTGLVLLQASLHFSLQVQPLRLFSRDPEAAVGMLRLLQEENADCLSPGWGRIRQRPEIQRSPHLKVAYQTLHTAEECLEILCKGKNYSEGFKGKCSNLNKIDQVCVTSEDASICNGDSGGPLVCGGYVFGVVSQVGSPCVYGGMQIFSGIGSILHIINNNVPYEDNDDDSVIDDIVYDYRWDMIY